MDQNQEKVADVSQDTVEKNEMEGDDVIKTPNEEKPTIVEASNITEKRDIPMEQCALEKEQAVVVPNTIEEAAILTISNEVARKLTMTQPENMQTPPEDPTGGEEKKDVPKAENAIDKDTNKLDETKATVEQAISKDPISIEKPANTDIPMSLEQEDGKKQAEDIEAERAKLERIVNEAHNTLREIVLKALNIVQVSQVTQAKENVCESSVVNTAVANNVLLGVDVDTGAEDDTTKELPEKYEDEEEIDDIEEEDDLEEQLDGEEEDENEWSEYFGGDSDIE